MKNQMKTNLFIAALGCSMLGTFLMGASGDATTSAAVSPVLQQPKSAPPAAASIAGETPKIPFTFYLSLVTTFTNGGSIDFDLVGEEGQSFIWSEMPKWREEQ